MLQEDNMIKILNEDLEIKISPKKGQVWKDTDTGLLYLLSYANEKHYFISLDGGEWYCDGERCINQLIEYNPEFQYVSEGIDGVLLK